MLTLSLSWDSDVQRKSAVGQKQVILSSLQNDRGNQIVTSIGIGVRTGSLIAAAKGVHMIQARSYCAESS